MKAHPLFAYGFRPNFLAAGLTATILVPLWAAGFATGNTGPLRWPGALWHGHELLFGFVAAAIAGFLLTAVPNWTGQRGFGGRPLVVLAILWLLGRVAPFAPAAVPAALVALADLLFLPAVAALVAPPLFRARNRNTPLLGVLVGPTPMLPACWQPSPGWRMRFAPRAGKRTGPGACRCSGSCTSATCGSRSACC